MFKKMDEVKVFRDPIHGYVKVEYQIIWDCINTKEFQRLRRIRQLGGAFVVYHTAEHSRFSHSLGVYEITRQIVEENEEFKSGLSEYDRVVAMLSALLHDIGHGPFSHSFEMITSVRHEIMTCRIISEDSEINKILSCKGDNLVNDVCSVIDKTHPNKILSQLVSGQLDADRMDYLLRDAYFTGTTYGEFDIARILRTLKIKDDKVVVKQSGIHSVEDYIMARYHMYWQVYYHPNARCFEVMLSSLFKRYKELLLSGHTSIFKPFDKFVLNEEISILEHFEMDENTCYYGIEQFVKCDDKILADLAYRVINRKLFKDEDLIDSAHYEDIRQQLIDRGFNAEYYLLEDATSKQPYVPYDGDKEDFIYVLSNDLKTLELSKLSVIVAALLNAEDKEDKKMYYPKEKEGYYV